MGWVYRRGGTAWDRWNAWDGMGWNGDDGWSREIGWDGTSIGWGGVEFSGP
jgi:hypothetical protein